MLLFDDRTRSVGERFAESDLLGIPAKVIVGNTDRDTGLVEVETRQGTRRVAVEDAAAELDRFGAGGRFGAGDR